MREIERVRSAVVAGRRESVLLDQIVDRDRALVLDVGDSTRPIEVSSSVTATRRPRSRSLSGRSCAPSSG